MGIRSINLPAVTLADELLVNREGGTGRQAISALAQQLALDGPLAAALAQKLGPEGLAALQTEISTLAAGQTSNQLVKASWTELQATPGIIDAQGAEVLDSDTGTHTDPVAGGTVANAGRYSWSVSPAGWQRIGATGLSGKANLADLEGAAEQRGRRASALTRRAQKDTLTVASLAARLTALENRVSAPGATIHCDPSATGANDGTSWTDAFPSLDAAISALQPGDRLWTNATEANPFPPTAVSASVVPANILWETNRGPDRQTWFSGARRGSWTDEGAGLFSIALPEAPVAVAYNYRRDDLAGTVTGCDLTHPKIAREIRKRGADPARLVAWYGGLRPSVPLATAAPAEGFWGYTGGRLVINPPGAPTLSQVDALAIWGDGANVFAINAETRNWSLRGDATVFFSPSPEGGNGYSLRFTKAQECSVEGVYSILSGYHSVGFVATSGARNVIRNCHTAGYWQGGIPYVFYTAGQDLPRAGHHLDRSCTMCWHLMDEAGVPVSLTHTTRTSYSHAEVGRRLSGIEYSDVLQVCFAGQIEAKHGLTLSIAGGFLSADSTGDVCDQTDEASFGIKARGCVALGHGSRLVPDISYIGCELDRLGYGNPAADLFSLATVGFGTGAWNIRLIDTVIRGGQHRYLWSLFAANDTAFLWGCTIALQTSAVTSGLFQITAAGPAGRLQYGNCTFEVAEPGRGIFIEPNDVFTGDPLGALQSLGGNIFGTSVTTPVRHSNSAVAPIGIAAFTAATDPTGRDLAGLSDAV